MFAEWGLLGNVLALLASLVVLDRASDWAITNSVKIADITGFGKTTIGFILVAFSTSLPELCVSVFAAFGGGEEIGVAVGNVLGSNIVNICLILGICFLAAALKSSESVKLAPTMAKEEMGTLYFGLFVASVVPLVLLYLRFAGRFIGVILLAIFVFYVYQLSKVRKIREEGSLGEERRKLPLYTLFTLLGITLVIVSAYFIVGSATYIAKSVGVPEIVIGATIVAFGTSLPELATSFDSVQKGHIDLALGNIVGSCFINITCILGVALIGANLEAVDMASFSHLVMFSLITNLLLWYFLSSERISWREGTILLVMYAIFIATSFGGYQQT